MPMITGNENNKGAFFNKRVFGVIALCLLVVVLIAGTLYFVFMHDQNGAEKSSEKDRCREDSEEESCCCFGKEEG